MDQIYVAGNYGFLRCRNHGDFWSFKNSTTIEEINKQIAFHYSREEDGKEKQVQPKRIS